MGKIIRATGLLALLTPVFVLPTQAEPSTPPPLLSREAADAMIQNRMAVAAAKTHERLQSIKRAPALTTWSAGPEGSQLILRRLPAKQWPVKPAPVENVENAFTEEQLSAMHAAAFEHKSIMLSATVYDGKISEVVWRKNQQTFTVLSNVDFNFLTMATQIQDGQTHWSNFVFVSNLSSENEQRLADLAVAAGETYVPQPIPDGSILDATKADYVIYAETEEEVPDELVEEMELLHRYYSENEQRLKVAWQNQKTLNEAQRAWNEAHPPKPKDTIINFWPVRSSN